MKPPNNLVQQSHAPSSRHTWQYYTTDFGNGLGTTRHLIIVCSCCTNIQTRLLCTELQVFQLPCSLCILFGPTGEHGSKQSACIPEVKYRHPKAYSPALRFLSLQIPTMHTTANGVVHQPFLSYVFFRQLTRDYTVVVTSQSLVVTSDQSRWHLVYLISKVLPTYVVCTNTRPLLLSWLSIVFERATMMACCCWWKRRRKSPAQWGQLPVVTC